MIDSRGGALVVAILAMGAGALMACVGDAPVQDGGLPDTGVDSTTPPPPDGGSEAAIDGGSEAAVDAGPPCPDAAVADAPYFIPDGSGVQCFPDGGAGYCVKGSSVCCSDPQGTLKCNSKNPGCGTDTTFECDKTSDCGGGRACCMRGSGPPACRQFITQTAGSYCSDAGTCPTSDIRVCTGPLDCISNGTCTPLQIPSSPSKLISGCR